MKDLNRISVGLETIAKEKVLQFGGGNFLRAFVDWMIDVYNDKAGADMGVVIVTPIAIDNYISWQEQDGLYHVLTRGLLGDELVDESHLVKCVSRIIHLHREWNDYLATAENPHMRFIVSNTTEAGIRFSSADRMEDIPPVEFPAKLTLWLYRRYQHFSGAPDKGCIVLPVELIDKNGDKLRECVLQNISNWGMEDGFRDWVLFSNIFCNTLVDRIVPGITKEALESECGKLGYRDRMVTQGEVFHFWVIEGPESVKQEFPLPQAGLNVLFTDDLTPYRTRKVRILNGAHTSLVPVAYLSGIETVRGALEDEMVGDYVRKVIFDEIVTTIDLPREEILQFASDVIDRFRNPFVEHKLLSISLNSISKFRTRVLPTIQDYQKANSELPSCLVFSMAALVQFYKGEYKSQEIPLSDDIEYIDHMSSLWSHCDGVAFHQLAVEVLSWREAWGSDLSKVPGFAEKLSGYLSDINQLGMSAAVRKLLSRME